MRQMTRNSSMQQSIRRLYWPQMKVGSFSRSICSDLTVLMVKLPSLHGLRQRCSGPWPQSERTFCRSERLLLGCRMTLLGCRVPSLSYTFGLSGLKVGCRPWRTAMWHLRHGMPKSTGLWQLLSHSFVHWFLTDQMQSWNHTHAGGRENPLMVVPFEGGEDPTDPPVCISSDFIFYCSFENIPGSTIYHP